MSHICSQSSMPLIHIMRENGQSERKIRIKDFALPQTLLWLNKAALYMWKCESQGVTYEKQILAGTELFHKVADGGFQLFTFWV